MTDTVYPVRGGMEDWAYASGWDYEKDATLFKCVPDTYTFTREEQVLSK